MYLEAFLKIADHKISFARLWRAKPVVPVKNRKNISFYLLRLRRTNGQRTQPIYARCIFKMASYITPQRKAV